MLKLVRLSQPQANIASYSSVPRLNIDWYTDDNEHSNKVWSPKSSKEGKFSQITRFEFQRFQFPNKISEWVAISTPSLQSHRFRFWRLSKTRGVTGFKEMPHFWKSSLTFLYANLLSLSLPVSSLSFAFLQLTGKSSTVSLLFWFPKPSSLPLHPSSTPTSTSPK